MADTIVFVADRDGMSSIFESAYLVPASLLNSSELVTGVVALVSLGTWLKPTLRRRWMEKVDAWRPALGLFWSYPILAKGASANVSDRLVIDHAFQQIGRKLQPRRLSVSTSSARLMPILAALRQAGNIDRLVYHILGPDAEEQSFAGLHGGGAAYEATPSQRLSRRQRLAISLADANISISGPMTSWLVDEMGARSETIFETPWLADARGFEQTRRQRDAMRKELGLSESFVLGYSGSMLSWQLEPAALARIIAAAQSAKKRVSFLGLSMHKNSLERALVGAGLPAESIRVLSISFTDVPKYLCAMDLGIIGRNLFRSPEIVNRLSSPVKFGEYLLSGVPVVLSEAIEDFAQLTRANNIGIVVSQTSTHDSIASEVRALFEDDASHRAQLRERCIDVGMRHLTYQSKMSIYARAHGSDMASNV